MPETEPEAQRLLLELARLNAEKAGWADLVTMTRLDRDRLQTELKNATRERDLARGQARKYKTVVDAASELLGSTVWVRSDLSDVTDGPVGRLRAAVDVIRDPGAVKRTWVLNAGPGA